MTVELINGVIHFPTLNTKLNDKAQAYVKAVVWMNMLNDYQKPVKWMRTNSKGTKIKFDFIKSQEQYNEGVQELKVFLADIKERFDLNFEVGSAEHD